MPYEPLGRKHRLWSGWGKNKVVAYHRQVPYRVLERIPEKSVLDSHGSDCGNMVIHGDNLEALKALLPEYEGKVDCIYIDPPYNTGNEGWVYNDNVNDPRIRKWLGHLFGKGRTVMDSEG